MSNKIIMRGSNTELERAYGNDKLKTTKSDEELVGHLKMEQTHA